MTAVVILTIIRILFYAAMAGYAMYHGRWAVWAVFTALVASTYIYAFSNISEIIVELIRTAVACGLIYITFERK